MGQWVNGSMGQRVNIWANGLLTGGHIAGSELDDQSTFN